jgi:hypothetical protein
MKGILFSGESIPAILDGRKTMTRRVIKSKNCPDLYPISKIYDEPIGARYVGGIIRPQYQPGEVVYVKETFTAFWQGILSVKGGYGGTVTFVRYEADGVESKCWPGHKGLNIPFDSEEGRKYSPLFMPQWAARIFLRITAVRAERIQDITHFDAQCEGAKMAPDDELREYGYRAGFKQLWDSINGKKHPWKNNDYVWVYEFERVEVSTNES